MVRVILLTIICTVFLQVSSAIAWDVLVVQNYRAKPYMEAVHGFRSACDPGVAVRELVMSELNGEDVAAEVRRRKPDLILAVGMDALIKVRKIREKPIIYLMVLNPDSVLEGERHITGVSMVIPPEKQLIYVRKVLPRAKTVGLIYNPKHTGPFVARAIRAAEKVGIRLVTRRVQKPQNFPEVLEGLKGEVDAYWMLPDTTIVAPEIVSYLIHFSMQNNLPILSFSEKYLKLGALLSIEINTFKLGKQAGEMAEKIFSGFNPNRVPRAEALDANVTLNYSVAEKMGITVNSDNLHNLRVSK